MESIPLSEAKLRLDELVERAVAGEEIIISGAKAGQIRLQPLPTPEKSILEKPERIPGRWKGRIQISDEKLLEPLTDEELAWMSGEN